MTSHQAASVRAFAQVWADSAYMHKPFHTHRDWLRESAARVVAPLLRQTPEATMSAITAIGRPPWDLDQRQAWVEDTTRQLVRLAP